MSRAARRAQWVLCLVSPRRVGAASPERVAAHAFSGMLPGVARPLWQSTDSSRLMCPRSPRGAPSRGSADADARDPGPLSPAPVGRASRAVPAELAAANHLQRAFTATAPNQKWAGDLTYIATHEGWLYLAVLMDLYSRRIIGWAMADRVTTALTSQALEMALHHRGVPSGLLHHSDRGCQYAAAVYQQRLLDLHIHCSMSRPGNCWDNAVVESFFATLKTELLGQRPFATRQAARAAIFEYVEGFYNRARRHATLGYLSPVEFEQRAAYSINGVH